MRIMVAFLLFYYGIHRSIELTILEIRKFAATVGAARRGLLAGEPAGQPNQKEDGPGPTRNDGERRFHACDLRKPGWRG
jgi:hypothetical protein